MTPKRAGRLAVKKGGWLVARLSPPAPPATQLTARPSRCPQPPWAPPGRVSTALPFPASFAEKGFLSHKLRRRAPIFAEAHPYSKSSHFIDGETRARDGERRAPCALAVPRPGPGDSSSFLPLLRAPLSQSRGLGEPVVTCGWRPGLPGASGTAGAAPRLAGIYAPEIPGQEVFGTSWRRTGSAWSVVWAKVQSEVRSPGVSPPSSASHCFWPPPQSIVFRS